MDITFTNSRSESITFGPPSFRVVSIGGLGDVDADIQVENAPYQDGSIYLDSILQERVIPIELKILAKDEFDLSEKRKLLSRIFNPKLGLGELKISIGARTYLLNPESDFVPQFGAGSGNMGDTYQRVQIQLTAPDPYWKDPQEVSRALRAYQGRFKLPTTFPIELGISGDTTYLNNEGDTETPVTIDVQGPVTNPQILNKTTGQYIKVNISLSENEVLHIDTNKQSKRAEVYRDGQAIKNAMGYLDHYSDFWVLDIGNNEIQYIADSGNANAIVAVAWKNQYVGI